MTAKSAIRYLTKITNSSKQLESALVCCFAQQHNLDISQSPFLNSCLPVSYSEQKTYNLVVAYLLSRAIKLTITDMVVIFGHLIPTTQKKSFGAVYTPREICDYIVKEVLKNRTSPPVVLEPSCGCGAFVTSRGLFLKKLKGGRLSSFSTSPTFLSRR